MEAEINTLVSWRILRNKGTVYQNWEISCITREQKSTHTFSENTQAENGIFFFFCALEKCYLLRNMSDVTGKHCLKES